MPYCFIRFLANTLLPSMAAAFFLGPKQRMPAPLRASTAPSTRGSSGATTARSMAWSLAKETMAGMSVAAMGWHSASADMPALPGRA